MNRTALLLPRLFVMLVLTYSCFLANPLQAAQKGTGELPAIISFLLMDMNSAISREIQVNWTPPSQREDNSALSESDIDFFRLRYKKAEEDSYTYLQIQAPASSALPVITALKGDDFELSIAAVDKSGLPSDYSAPVSFSF